MPGADGKLVPAEFRLVQDWLARNGFGEHVCPICNNTEWAIGEYLVHPTTMSSLLFSGAPNFPNVLLISPCGYTVFMNAVYMGLVPGQKK